jgi:Pyridoxamine 5'-phosphate oxidase
MAVKTPAAELHAGFSSKGATPTDWARGRQHMEEAQVFWLSTVRPDGRPHVTPLFGRVARRRDVLLHRIG